MPEMVNAASAAEILGVDKRTVLRLARAGKIRSFRTPGGQHRFRREDVESLTSGNGHKGELRSPASAVQNKREEVEGLNLEVQARRARRDLAKIEAEDAEAERQKAEEQRAEALANKRALAEIRLTHTQAREQRQREARQEEARKERATWENAILDAALAGLPRDVPADVRKAVGEAVRDALALLGPGESPQLVESVTDEAVNRALQPWRRALEIQQAIEKAERILPCQARSFFEPTGWQLRARAAASTAIRALPADAPLAEISAAAAQAARKIAAEIERSEAEEKHFRDCRRAVDYATLRVLPSDSEQATQAIRESLAQLPIGCGEATITKATDRVLAPFERRKQAAERVSWYLPRVSTYIEELGAPDGEWVLGDYSERRKLAAQFEKKIRPQLIEQYLSGEVEDGEDAEEFIKDFIDRELEEEDSD